VGDTVCSIGVGGSDFVKFLHMPTGQIKEVEVEPRSLYIMKLESRYNCVHMIEPRDRKTPRLSVVAVEMYRPPLSYDMGVREYKDFTAMGSYGVWQHLDEVRGYTNFQQKVDILRQMGKIHFPRQSPYFENRFADLAAYAAKYRL